MFTATCHCENVRIKIPELPASVTSCNCSICRRYGALWAYSTRDRVRLEAEPGTLSSYRWGDGAIDFWHCTRCGCMTHYTSVDGDGASRFALNARMLPLEILKSLPVRRFDGADSWQYID